MDSLTYKLTPAPLCYEVQFGYSCCHKVAFASFEMALAFYRGYLRCQAPYRKVLGDPSGFDDGPRLVNVANIDGAPDAGLAAQHGLTAAEWEALQDADAT